MSIIPSIQDPLFRVVVNLSNVSVVVVKRQARDHLRVGVSVKRVWQVCIVLIVVLRRVQNAAYDEAVAIAIAPEPGPPGRFPLHAQIVGVQPAQDDHLL